MDDGRKETHVPIKERVVPDSRRDLLAAYMENGMPVETIGAAARLEEYSWADIAGMTGQAYENKGHLHEFRSRNLRRFKGSHPDKSPDQVEREADMEDTHAVTALLMAGDYTNLSKRLRGEKATVNRGDGEQIELGPPTEEELREMFGESYNWNPGKAKN